MNGHLDIVRLLCDRGTDVEARNIIGSRPLHWAAIHGHISVVKELIDEKNADINARLNNERTTLSFARYKSCRIHDFDAYLISHGGIE